VTHCTKTVQATTWFSRLKGLLATSREEWLDKELAISPCRTIHTIAMNYPLDIAFYDRNSIVLTVHRSIKPNRVIRGPRATYGAIERVAQDRAWYQVGETCKGEYL